MTHNVIDLRSPIFLLDSVQDVLARSKALVNTATKLAIQQGEGKHLSRLEAFEIDRMIYQLEAIEMLIEKYQDLFSDAEHQLMRLEFAEKKTQPDLASAA